MNKLSLLILFFALSFVVGCTKDQECHIEGTIHQGQTDVNGSYIFLVPFYNTDSVGVDSVKIQNNKFEFITQKNMLAKLVLDYHVRYGYQPLLVVAEPGNVQVVIDSISSAKGTINNDSLQVWKNLTEQFQLQGISLRKAAMTLAQHGDTASAIAIKKQYDIMHNDYKEKTNKLASQLPEGDLKKFLSSMFLSK